MHDPGITVIEVLCYALTVLHHRSGTLDDRVRVLLQTVAERASALAVPSAESGVNDDCGPGLQRVNYFFGKLLGVDDFTTEQDYVRSRLQRHNRLLHGTGIVSGLDVAVAHDSTGSRITVAPGLAFDPTGNEICIEQPADLALPPPGADLYVLVRYSERPCRWVPVVAGATADAANESLSGNPTRIVEPFGVELAAAPTADAVALARLQQVRGRWRVDARFKALRVGAH